MASEDWADGGAWELVNDDGFVYKRKKRSDVNPPPPQPDPAAEVKNRLERKKRALTKIKQKYQREIDQWELLSNTLKGMQQKAETQVVKHQGGSSSVSFVHFGSECEPLVQSSDSTFRRFIDQLLSQVEAQEAVIHGVSNLCDVAEALCTAQEERLKQSFIDLPIWAPSPLSGRLAQQYLDSQISPLWMTSSFLLLSAFMWK